MSNEDDEIIFNIKNENPKEEIISLVGSIDAPEELFFREGGVLSIDEMNANAGEDYMIEILSVEANLEKLKNIFQVDTERKQFNAALFGANGTGKTTLEIEIMCDYAYANPLKRELIIVPDDGERKFDSIEEMEITEDNLRNFRGIKKVIAEDSKIFELLLKIYTQPITDSGGKPVLKDGKKQNEKFNGLVVCDDLGVILSRRPTEAIKLFKRRRQANMDMLWTFHVFETDIPKAFFGYLTSMVMFQTSGGYEDTVGKIDPLKRAEFVEIYNRVQREAEKNQYYREEMILRAL